MTTRDTVQVDGNTLTFAFRTTGETGASGQLRLDRSLRLVCDANTVYAENDSGGRMCIDRFATSKLAENALVCISNEITKYMARTVRVARLKTGFRAVGFMVLATYLIAVYGTLAGISARPTLPIKLPAGEQGLGPEEALRIIKAIGNQEGPPELGALSGQKAQAQDIMLPPEKAKKLLAIGAEAGYSVQLSAGTKGTVYVFADPACPVCQSLEPELEILGRDYTIHVFPVSVIGREASTIAGAQVMCGDRADRASAWRKTIAAGGTPDTQNQGECQEGRSAIEKNNAFFRNAGFPGTPMVLDGDGNLMPGNVPHASHALAAWLQQPRPRVAP
ncbi:DsbC family protein [Achromobacter insuavis]|uniref:DsbC family protein n=1 Tax=Achromobacter insuavis TaxID=1287735 RepID=UPI001F142968|nr:DsbC family protein [Achromobacter insuavis]